MSVRVDPTLLPELHKYGAFDIDACFNCGNCTAICPLSEDATPFPRKSIRYLQLGARQQLLGNVDPWLCYYCGECTDTCPREADPGEAMMAMRRYLTSRYDWTGFSRKFYTSKVWEIASICLVGALVVAIFYFFHGPIVTDRVELLTFAPVFWVEVGDWIMFVVLSGIIGINILRMYLSVMRAEPRVKVPIWLYVTQAKELVLHFLTQKRFTKCENLKMYWINHLLLMSGYCLMLILIVVLLRWFQTDNIYPLSHPQRWLGYYAFFALMYGTVAAMIGRIRKRDAIHKHSHPTDWMFLVLLLLTSVTGILVHSFRYLALPLPTYYMFVAHVAIAVPMLVLEVPFAKWAHLAYRPIAVYLYALKRQALQLQQ